MTATSRALVALLLLVPGAARALEIRSHTVAAGGDVAGDGFRLRATVGEAAAHATSTGGTFAMSGGFWPSENPDIVDAPIEPMAPTAVRFLGASPNPFNPRTVFRFELPAADDVRLRVFDTGGRLVTELAARSFSAGRHEVVWDGTNTTGRSVASGVYVAAFTAGTERRTQRLILLK